MVTVVTGFLPSLLQHMKAQLTRTGTMATKYV